MNFSPEMMKMAAGMMKNMSPEDFQRMSAMAGAAGGMPQAGAGDTRLSLLAARCCSPTALVQWTGAPADNELVLQAMLARYVKWASVTLE